MKRFHLVLDKKLYEKLKEESQKKDKKIAELIREKIQIADQKESEILKKVEFVIDENFEKLAEIFEANLELINTILNDIKNEQIFLKKALKLTTFYTVYSSLFLSLKFQSVRNLTSEEFEQLRKIRTDWEEKADKIVKQVLGESVLAKIRKADQKN